MEKASIGVILSIVVPIYNVERYLSRCIDSLLNQDLSEDKYEILLIDDGSPDRCGFICDEYALKYPNVKVIHQRNGGLSAARNTGIQLAKGQYVQFVDPDDYLEANVLKALLEKMEAEDLDVLRFNYQNVNERYEVFEPNKVSKPFVDYRDEICDGLTFLTERLGFGCYAWQFMIRHELLEGCAFKVDIYFEDTEWTPRLLMKAKRVTSSQTVVYNYLMREGSITQSVDEKKQRKVLNDKLLLLDALKGQMRYLNDRRWFEGMIAQTVLSIIGYVNKYYYQERKTMLLTLKSKGIFPLSDYHATVSAKRKINMANLSLGLLMKMIHLQTRFN